MMTQHEEMVSDLAALQDLALEDLTPASMAQMELLIERLAWNLELASGAGQAADLGLSA